LIWRWTRSRAESILPSNIAIHSTQLRREQSSYLCFCIHCKSSLLFRLKFTETKIEFVFSYSCGSNSLLLIFESFCPYCLLLIFESFCPFYLFMFMVSVRVFVALFNYCGTLALSVTLRLLLQDHLLFTACLTCILLCFFPNNLAFVVFICLCCFWYFAASEYRKGKGKS
jgi:hypothetical protein